MVKLSTDLLPAINIEIGSDPFYSIIWLHGLGADGSDLVPIINELRLPPRIHIRFVFPHAPLRSVSINNGAVMRAWYDIFDLNPNRYEDEVGIRNSQHAINRLVEQEICRGILSENIILAGFSQGGVIALQTGLRYSKKLAGIVALSCYLPLVKTIAAEIQQANCSIPIFMAHGSNDPVISVKQALDSRDILIEANCIMEWHEYSMEHTICSDEIIDISNWLMQTVKCL